MCFMIKFIKTNDWRNKIIKLKLIKKNEWPQQCFWIKRYSESSLDNEINISVINYSSTK